MVETKARARLNAKLQGSTQSSLAEDLGIHQSRISQWASGHGRPEAHYREALRILLGIPTQAWFTDAEAEVVKRASLRRSTKRAACSP